MFDKKKIDIIYRLICLGIFFIVILFDQSIITLGMLALFFLIVTKKDYSFTFIFLYILTFIMFCVSYLGNNNFCLKLFIIIDYCFYFLNIPSVKTIINRTINEYVYKNRNIKYNEIGEESDNDYLRFKKSLRMKKKNIWKTDLATTLYVTVHFVVLFISILIG